MTEKKLHELNISQLTQCKEHMGISVKDLKQWAKSIVDNCQNTEDFTTNNLCGYHALSQIKEERLKKLHIYIF